MKRLFVDLDGTLARFHDAITDESGNIQIEKMYTDDFFLNLFPFENMVEAIKLFMKNYPDIEVYILSAADSLSSLAVIKQKNLWIDRYLPDIDKQHRIYPEIGKNKIDYIPYGLTGEDYLLDDYNKNLEEFRSAGGHSIKCRNNINHRGIGAYGGDIGNVWHGCVVSYDDSSEVIAGYLKRYLEV